jgi:hypothetical protein
MNPSDLRHPWQRLASAARQAPDDRAKTAPYGFATRVAAQAFSGESLMPSLLSRFSLRALGLACLLMVGTAATSYSSISKIFSEDESSMWSDDPVAELVEIAS